MPTLACQLLALSSYKCGPGIQPAGRDILVMNSKSHFLSAILKHSSAKPSPSPHSNCYHRLSVLSTKSLSSPCVLCAPRQRSLSPSPTLLALGFILASSPPAHFPLSHSDETLPLLKAPNGFWLLFAELHSLCVKTHNEVRHGGILL